MPSIFKNVIILHSAFYTKSSKSSVCFILAAYLSLWTDYIPSAQYLHEASGYYIGQYRVKISQWPRWPV